MVLIDPVGLNLDEIRGPKKVRRPNFFVRFFSSLFLILFFSALIFLTINFPAYFLIYRYRLNPESLAQKVPSAESPVNKLSDNSLAISKISVNSPVHWDTNPTEILPTLEDNLAHVSGSGKPGEGKNIFITGHSSNYWWKKGNLNTVFALLPELSEKDEILLSYQGKIHRYVVSERKEVPKKEVTNHFYSDSEQLTLVTCVPVGTNLRRLIIIAKPI